MRKLLILILFSSCFEKQESNSGANSKLLTPPKVAEIVKRDTTILFDIEGLSSEGCEAKAFYIKGIIKKIDISCCYVLGKAESTLIFDENEKITVKEKNYKYKTTMSEVKSNSDIILENEFSYKINFKGDIIERPQNIPDAIINNFYVDIKNQIPFVLTENNMLKNPK